MARHAYDTTLTFTADGAEYEIDVTVSYTVGSDDEVENITLLKVGDRFRPWGFHHWSDSHFAELAVEQLEASETHLLAMIEAASEDEAGVEDVIAERRWEITREYAA